MNVKLPHFFCFKSTIDLVRVGKPNDGGYLVSKSDIYKTEILIGLGINDDWSFEEEFQNIKNIPVIAYDASISQRYFFYQLVKSFLKFKNPSLIFHWIKVILDYRKYFSKLNNKHVKQYVGLNCDDPQHVTLSSILNKIERNNIFLKIDIEGSEYRILDDLILNQKKISGLVIEFHDCDINLDKIKYFISSFDLKLVHVHINNISQISLINGIPLIIELTFSKYSENQLEPKIPHPLDMPNVKNVDDINFSIEQNKFSKL